MRRVSWVHWLYPGSKRLIDLHASITDEVRGSRAGTGAACRRIDAGSVYPDELLRRLGEVGAWGSHVPWNGAADLRCAIQSIAALGEVCGATAFMAWCQNTLVWYVANSTNMQLAQRFGDCFSSGRRLGGTGLSNPMKTFFGIEKFKLKGRKVEGGYIVKGALPWVSNLGADHFFGTIFEREDEPGHRDVPRRLLQSGDHAATVQAVSRDGRDRHLQRAVPRRLRAG